ncbi:ABC transporter substrate-binding protein [Aestuariivirga sp. YIM B02566]|uniref:ABC transporter substrate-binding protein n=1 Tax=Taklimakanibacter albus TaxID=2800327 RepID=A0ACC5R1Z8_9HYPH|nr:ABC transporter substrate-binding protein [Aestuariivirga sp. YIM B02566]MBK1866597.1 ABC transporter substrate-binding protein [Aestuariivirga sp. YIM B02566]
MRSNSTAALMALALSSATAIFQAGPAFAEEPQKGGTLRILGSAEVDRFDTIPPATSDAVNFQRAVWRQLISFAASADTAEQVKAVGDLAEDVPVPTNNGLTYTFKLRQGAMWNAPGGARQITSEDIERGFKRMCNPAIGSPHLTYFENLIVGLADYCAGFAKVEAKVEPMKAYIEANDITGIETPSADVVTFNLKTPANDFIYLLSLATAAPAPVEVLNYMPDSPEYRTNFISNGPYTIESYVPDSMLRLVRNPAWKPETDPLRKAYVDAIEIVAGVQADAAMQQLQSGDGDMLYDHSIPPASAQMLIAQGDEKMSTVTTGRTRFVWINTVSNNNGGALKNVKVRQALSYAMDKAAIVQQLGGPTFAKPLNGIFPPNVIGYHEFDLYPSKDAKGDPEKAKALLTEAGYPNGLKLKMPYRNIGSDPALAQTIQESLKKAGFEIEISPVPPADFYPRLITNFSNAQNGVWDLVPAGWSPDWPGGAAGSIFLPQYSYNGTHGTFNFSDYNSDRANELAAKASATTDAEESVKLWQQVDETVMADAPTVPLVAVYTMLYHGPAVRNFLPYAPGGQGDWTNVWLSR